MTYPLAPLTGRFWRMLSVRWQRQPFASGAHLTGGRWNPPGMQTLYLSRDYTTAIMEMHQDLVRPGTLAAYDVDASDVADLTMVSRDTTLCLWRAMHQIEHRDPPTWAIARSLVAAGAAGALVPSAIQPGGINLVLWRWHDAGKIADGASLTLVDPEHALIASRQW